MPRTTGVVARMNRKDELKKKICFVSSSGGHWEELMCLKPLAEKYNSFFVTEQGEQAEGFIFQRMYAVPQINRHEKNFMIHFLSLFYEANKILKQERPNIVISTGALVSFPFCLLAKLRGGKVIFIESFARVNNASLTGRLVYKFADLFLVQWKSMLKVYPKAKYVGGIF